MQYIFGDNRSSYAVIYTDTTAAEAQTLNKLIRFQITPNKLYNTRGFLTYGTNSCCPMFFSIKKDNSIPRSCYYTHAFNREADPKYFSGDAFLNDIFTTFVDQERFDELRDGAEGGVTLKADTALAAAADSRAVADPRVIREVVASLYRKNRVLLVVDDEKYSDELVCVLLKQIYGYLTPSLRKSTTYLTAVVEVGGMDISIRIVPRSMLTDSREKYMSIDGSDFEPAAEDVYHKLADFIMGSGNEQNKAIFFENYEVLYSGFDTIYKKQNAEELFTTITTDDLVKLEKIVDSFLLKHPVENRSDITPLAENLCRVFNDPAVLAERFVFQTTDVLKPESIMSANNLFIYKLKLFSDIGVRFLGRMLVDACNNLVLSTANYDSAVKAVESVKNCAANPNAKPHEKFFYASIAVPVFGEKLLPRCLTFREMYTAASNAIIHALDGQDPIEPEDEAELKQYLISEANAEITKFNEKGRNIDLTAYIDDFAKKRMDKHNLDLMSGANGKEPRYPHAKILETLRAIEYAITSGKNAQDIENLFFDTVYFQKEYTFVIDNLIAMYVSSAYARGNAVAAVKFVKGFCDDARTASVCNKLRSYDCNLYYAFSLDVADNTDMAAGKLVDELIAGKASINKMSDGQSKALSDTVCKALLRAVKASKVSKADLMKNLKSRANALDNKSNIYSILDSMIYVCKNGELKPVKASGGGSKAGMIVCVIIAVLAVAVAALFATGILGGGDDVPAETTGKKDEITVPTNAGFITPDDESSSAETDAPEATDDEIIDGSDMTADDETDEEPAEDTDEETDETDGDETDEDTDETDGDDTDEETDETYGDDTDEPAVEDTDDNNDSWFNDGDETDDSYDDESTDAIDSVMNAIDDIFGIGGDSSTEDGSEE